MASTFTSSLRIEKQGDGENTNTWGTKENNSKEILEDAIAGYDSIAVTGGSLSLTASNAATDQSRMAMLKFTGTLATNQIIIIPSVSKKYTIWNTTAPTLAETFTIKTSGGTSLVLPSGAKVDVFCDGTDTHITSPTLLNAPLDANDRVISQGVMKDWGTTVFDLGDISGVLGAGAIDYSKGHIQTARLTGDVTIANNTIANWPITGVGGDLMLKLSQDGTGGWDLTLGSIFKIAGGVFVLSTGPNTRDRLGMLTEDGGVTVDTFAAQNFS